MIYVWVVIYLSTFMSVSCADGEGLSTSQKNANHVTKKGSGDTLTQKGNQRWLGLVLVVKLNVQILFFTALLY